MSPTYRQLVEDAFAELAISGFASWETTPEEQQWAFRRLLMMLGEWAGRGLIPGLRVDASDAPAGIEDESGCPSWAVLPVVLNLAMHIANGKGRQVTTTLYRLALDGMTSLAVRSAIPGPAMMPGNIPLGAGNGRCAPFSISPTLHPLPAAETGKLDFLKGTS